MSARRFQFTVDHMIGRREVEVVVTYSMTPVVAATYWQPAEGGEVEIVSVKVDGTPVTLSDAEEDTLLEQAIARSADDCADEDAAEADYRYDQYRDRQMVERWDRERGL